ncbi:hypothetical protein F8M41_024921 [Gigaspora margarita]|uniref:Uncharacterized protein n=1 Tax=Gigaspora margarita TaxID=4874 RepID=A0A8H4B091_GIGMA|nr:hypothetical protein F8M41_024921 [Gigaspora margarita]
MDFPYDRTGSAIHQYDINFDDFPPPGTVEVPFKFTDTNQSLKLIAGFIGANQDISDNEAIISPVIGWSIVDDDDDSTKNSD